MQALILGLPAGSEWIILAILALLIFGGSRLAGIGKNAGRAIREFKEETSTLGKGDEPAKPSEPQSGVGRAIRDFREEASGTPSSERADDEASQPKSDNQA